MRKEYLPMALGFWGVAIPLLVFGFAFGRSLAERTVVLISSGIFFIIGTFIFRAKK